MAAASYYSPMMVALSLLLLLVSFSSVAQAYTRSGTLGPSEHSSPSSFDISISCKEDGLVVERIDVRLKRVLAFDGGSRWTSWVLRCADRPSPFQFLVLARDVIGDGVLVVVESRKLSSFKVTRDVRSVS
ncbi:uncharacterized protein HKW66_Vig0129180 [Vigna angularis]|uniref:Uncharacterized protein n=1 Tax=Phaseolus angularis TaxID=3914 RepID=A0A8T0K2M1_PHAAN|nr:uncharacterized protein HKW66_Vig0129180 [Vigna angularis]